MIRTRLPVLIALIVAMIFNCGVTVAEPNQTSADYVMPGCRDAASLISFSNTEESKDEASLMSLRTAREDSRGLSSAAFATRGGGSRPICQAAGVTAQ